jgi:hypothetical protein
MQTASDYDQCMPRHAHVDTDILLLHVCPMQCAGVQQGVKLNLLLVQCCSYMCVRTVIATDAVHPAAAAHRKAPG